MLVINAATTLLIFLLTRRLIDNLAAVVAAATFSVLAVGQSVQGVFANAEHFVILPMVGGLVLLLRAVDTDHIRSLTLSGLLLGLAFLMKQHGAAFVALGAVYMVKQPLSLLPNCQASRLQSDL